MRLHLQCKKMNYVIDLKEIAKQRKREGKREMERERWREMERDGERERD